PAPPVSPQRALLNQYCVGCHNQRAKAAGQEAARKLTLDDLDVAKAGDHADAWEMVVRKMRAGMMPPANARRPDKATYNGFIAWLETELDRGAQPYMPPPGLHRLNRTEYANVVRDLLDLDIDPAQYLPSDDSTHGFDNIAGALGISSTLVEAYVSAAAKISRLAVGEPAQPTLVIYRTPEDTSQDYHIEGLPVGTLGVTFLATNFAPVLDLDRHFMRDTLQTGPTPGFTFFPHVGTIRIEGPYDATPAKQSASRDKVFVCHPAGVADPSTGSGSSRG